MKENAIKKINKIGKVSSILAKIGEIIIGISIVLAIVGLVAIMCLPKNFVNLEINGDAKVTINTDKLIKENNHDKLVKLCEDINSDDSDVNFDLLGAYYSNAVASVEDNTLIIDTTGSTRAFNLHDLFPVILVGILYLIATFVTLIFIRKLALAFKNCATPFEENVIKAITNLAYSVIPWAFVNTLAENFVKTFFSGKPEITIGFDFAYLLVVLVLLALSFIFKYGAILQQESDETL